MCAVNTHTLSACVRGKEEGDGMRWKSWSDSCCGAAMVVAAAMASARGEFWWMNRWMDGKWAMIGGAVCAYCGGGANTSSSLCAARASLIIVHDYLFICCVVIPFSSLLFVIVVLLHHCCRCSSLAFSLEAYVVTFFSSPVPVCLHVHGPAAAAAAACCCIVRRQKEKKSGIPKAVVVGGNTQTWRALHLSLMICPSLFLSPIIY